MSVESSVPQVQQEMEKEKKGRIISTDDRKRKNRLCKQKISGHVSKEKQELQCWMRD